MEPEESTVDDAQSSTRLTVPVLWQAVVRERVTPLLPPPVTRGIIGQLDPWLEPYVGPEATVTLTCTFMVCWIVLWLFRSVIFNRSGRAVDDDEGKLLASTSGNKAEKFDATVLLVGPRNSGKTRLFYQLCYSENDMPTLMSLKANVGVSTAVSNGADDAKEPQAIRYMDWPGYTSLLDPELAPVMKAPNLRVVLVLDSNQSVTSAADTLYQLLQLLSSESKRKDVVTVFVACHKKDMPKAKNDRRIKIQLRTELERLLTVRAATNDAATWWKSGEPVELDALDFVQFHFCSTTCTGPGPVEVQKFCLTGRLVD